MTCEKYKSRIAAAAAELENVGPGFSLASQIRDSELAAHLKICAACQTEFESRCALLDSIDRGLAAMLAPEPSGDFAVHVRRRNAEQAVAPRPWFAGWQLITATALLILVVLIGMFTIGRPPREPQSARETPLTPVVPEEKSRAVAPSEVHAPVAAVRPPPRGSHSAVIREPEVLVPREEMLAVAQLLNANWSGRADGASLTAQAAPMSETLKPMAIEELKIPALEVIPLGSGAPPKSSQEK